MLRRLALVVLASTLMAPAAFAQGSGMRAEPDFLGTVSLPANVLANGAPLAAGEYRLRLTTDRPTMAGQPVDSQRWVELVRGEQVVAREIAEVLSDEDLPPVGASAQPVGEGVRVQMLQGGEFLRISVKRGQTRYLIHLPVAGQR